MCGRSTQKVLSKKITLLLAAIGVMTVALAGAAWAAPGAPTVVSTTPADATGGHDYDINVRVRFSEAMKEKSIKPATVYLLEADCHSCPDDLPVVPARVTYNANNRTASINPDQPLRDINYFLIVEGRGDGDNVAVKDRGGTAMAEEFFAGFSVGTACGFGCGPV
jgi:Bacterial Ig-like domain